MRDYQGVVMTTPVSLGYQRQSAHGAPWFIGMVLRELILRAGLSKPDIEGLAISSFSLGVDSVVSLTRHPYPPALSNAATG
jgi:hypothetical protein